jgi:DNA invertase Pin-like site-specific DNA recombinase
MRDLTPKPQRCAIYTRKSTEHNLDLAFNSLDAQREACEAYIKSQAHEGWRLIFDRFDDGGLSGASLERPALQGLLAAVRAGQIDVIVVYKVDRLTRSLADFAKLVELFDRHGVSFVSVTQSFNTTTSMGRLTLNVLLSFAQFEREVIGERVKDKIAASKRKGLWVGGPIPLGYQSENKKLVMVEQEAALVRHIYQRYLELGSIGLLVEDLARCGIKTRKGGAFTVGPIAHILKNRFYIGEVVYRGTTSRGEHPPLIDKALFKAVQAKLDEAAVVRRTRTLRSSSPLTGLLYDDAGNRMSPSHSRKDGVRYRYYVSQALLQHRKSEAGSVTRLPAPDFEVAVVAALRSALAEQGRDHADISDDELISAHVERIVVTRDRIDIAWRDHSSLAGEDADRVESDGRSVPLHQLTVPWHRPSTIRRKGIAREPRLRPRLDPVVAQSVLTGIAKARLWMKEILDGVVTIGSLAERERMGERNLRRLLPLACLSPRLIAAIAEGQARSDCTLSALTSALAHSWADQEKRFGLL